MKMVDVSRIRAVVQELEDRGERATVRRIHGQVGGSFRDIVRALGEIKGNGNALPADGNAPKPSAPSRAEVPSDSPHEVQDPAVGDPTGAEGAPVRKVCYRCARYQELRVRHLRFVEGLLVTGDKQAQALIEQSDLFGVEIFIDSES
jgi:hypothetical protein